MSEKSVERTPPLEMFTTLSRTVPVYERPLDKTNDSPQLSLQQ